MAFLYLDQGINTLIHINGTEYSSTLFTLQNTECLNRLNGYNSNSHVNTLF